MRYERARPGELIHIDVKKLGRIQGGAGHRITGQQPSPTTHRPARGRRADRGWEFVHVAIDDATRLAYVEVLADEKATTAVGFLRRAVAYFAALRHHRRAPDHRQRLAPTARPSTRSPAARWASATSAPAPTDPRPTARPSASSAPCSAAGPTARSTAQAPNAPPPLTAGSTLQPSPPTRALSHKPPITRAEQPPRVLQLGHSHDGPRMLCGHQASRPSAGVGLGVA